MMEGWSEYERQEFFARMGELSRRMSESMREQMAGTIDAHPELGDQLKSHGLVLYNDVLYGTLISPTNSRELGDIRREAILLSAEDRGAATGDEVHALLERILSVLAMVFVTVEPPHMPIGKATVLHIPIDLLLILFNLAYVRRGGDPGDDE